ncbi:pilus assembly protein PilO [Clostridium beijerinckii]|uniref:Pilus assembly protein PilO n=1 Tax=Clostridium beijerinckii TaxID=1520 RepID=A0A1S8S0H9_CLOBE|nr:pilus assembly protein PilO [Clostridium beijerinckii]NRY59957.1 type IV pilus assembly protein PilO [Clostridium beijerinckii]OOM58785.1 hypothetical protein CLBCK_38210 [Clostridium beijerinckii]
MKISNREKVMLFVLGIILIGFGYYNFVYSVQATAIEQKVKQESEIKKKYETSMITINSLEIKENDAKLLKEKIEEESKPFYPIISEEYIILEIDKLLKDSELKGTMKFNPIVCDAVENVDKKSGTLPNSTLQQIVDKYNDKNVSNHEEATTTTNTNNKDASVNNSNDKSGSNSKDSKDKKKDTVQYIKFQVNFEGSYDGIYKFISAIGENDRKIVVNSIKLSSDTSKGIKGTVNLEIYSIPKIDDDLSQYLQWNLNNDYGKDVPFSAGTADGSSSSTGTNVKETTKTAGSDFLASVKSITSDLPKIMIGKAKDDLRTTYVYGDSNSEEKAEMILTQDGDKYYYKYKTSKGTFPANYDGPGEEFIPMSKDIVLGIMSESRVNANDNSAIRLNIINKTDKTVDVNISGDDSANPRVTIDGNSDNVRVN